ncbi:hypothetical protein F4813DRAFT_395449 [Daldinia decipiens]|uniref:uncharacterized protein n=1 Tax=Daldinia decipiens TaxID=326647 RepID=UPI0020C2FAB7|nr:uncharacterized protein F4813DRAFT_395449 [Daldinia decipiens]KAI1658999.1 hypothetical protein F4813DRAFT_395449 [Daldinia decipiens]
MATVVTANESPGDLEEGQARLKSTRRVSCVRDITYKVIPCCIVSLILVSAGGVLIATLAYNKPVPQKPVIVISIMLAVLFFIFGIGGCYLYRMKHYPPLTEGPNAPDRPPVKTWKDKIKRCCELIIEKLSDDKTANDPPANVPPFPPQPEALNGPAELSGANDQESPWQEAIEQPPNAQLSNTARCHNPVNRDPRNHDGSTQPTRRISRRPVPNSHYNSMQANHTIPRRPGSNYTAYSPNSQVDSFPMDGPSYCHGYPYTPSPRRREPKPKGPRPEPQPSVPEFPWPGRQAARHVGPQIYFTYISDSINRQAFADIFPKPVRGRLYMFEDLPISAGISPEAAKPEQRSRQHRKKPSKQQGNASPPNSPVTESEDSPINTPSPSPKQKPSSQKPARKDSDITAISHQAKEKADEKGKTKDTSPRSSPKPPHRRTKPEQHEAIKKGLRSRTTIDSSGEGDQEHRGPRALADIKRDIEELSERWQQLLHEARLSGEPSRGQAWLNGTWAGYSDFSDQRHSRTSTGVHSSRSSSTPSMAVSESSPTRSCDW